MSARLPHRPRRIDTFMPVMNPDTTPHSPGSAGAVGDANGANESWPEDFSKAVESMHAAELRDEISLGTIRPPQRLSLIHI